MSFVGKLNNTKITELNNTNKIVTKSIDVKEKKKFEDQHDFDFDNVQILNWNKIIRK